MREGVREWEWEGEEDEGGVDGAPALTEVRRLPGGGVAGALGNASSSEPNGFSCASRSVSRITLYLF